MRFQILYGILKEEKGRQAVQTRVLIHSYILYMSSSLLNNYVLKSDCCWAVFLLILEEKITLCKVFTTYKKSLLFCGFLFD